jgi:hypothetical protein
MRCIIFFGIEFEYLYLFKILALVFHKKILKHDESFHF